LKTAKIVFFLFETGKAKERKIPPEVGFFFSVSHCRDLVRQVSTNVD
jgi:hypothetical protein